MTTNYLLPHKYKKWGWILFIIGVISGILLRIIEGDYNSNLSTIQTLALYNSDSIIDNFNGFFKIIENDLTDELITLAIIIGGLLIAFTKEKIEDEFIYKLRTESLIWSVIVNYIILILATIFIFGMTFFDVLVFNMFTPLLFFIFRFNFLKLKSRSDEE